MKVFVDPDACLGCGVCEGIAPEVFQLGDEPYATVLINPVPAELEEVTKEAAEECPEEAIKVEE